MKEHEVYFEIFGKEMKATMISETKEEAKQKVINKIKWHKVVEKPLSKDNQLNSVFEDMFDMLGVKKKS